jgi:hypothetical protein
MVYIYAMRVCEKDLRVLHNLHDCAPAVRTRDLVAWGDLGRDGLPLWDRFVFGGGVPPNPQT